jgi:hypothetical protein
MKSFKYIILITAIISATLYSCYYDKEELLYPVQAACDTTNVTYSLKVAPILTANCTSCHNATTANAGIKLESVGDVQTNINQAYGAIINGIMPPEGEKLNDCSISILKIWKDAGAINN